jgi:hypothetical protein
VSGRYDGIGHLLVGSTLTRATRLIRVVLPKESRSRRAINGSVAMTRLRSLLSFHWHIKPGPWLLALLAGLAFYTLVAWGIWGLTHPERPAVHAVTPNLPDVGHRP